MMVLMRFVIDLCQSLHFPNIHSKLVIMYYLDKVRALKTIIFVLYILNYKTFNQLLFIIIFSNCEKEIFFTLLVYEDFSLISLN